MDALNLQVTDGDDYEGFSSVVHEVSESEIDTYFDLDKIAEGIVEKLINSGDIGSFEQLRRETTNALVKETGFDFDSLSSVVNDALELFETVDDSRLRALDVLDR